MADVQFRINPAALAAGGLLENEPKQVRILAGKGSEDKNSTLKTNDPVNNIHNLGVPAKIISIGINPTIMKGHNFLAQSTDGFRLPVANLIDSGLLEVSSPPGLTVLTAPAFLAL